MKPVVLVSADRRSPKGFADSPRIRPRRDEVYVLEAYLNAIRDAGGLPLVLPPGPLEEHQLDRLLSAVDAVVLTGGDMDIHPSHYGQAVTGRLDRVEPGRTELELALAKRCLKQGVPVLGVCGGMQVLAVASGGTLVQDLTAPTESGIFHEQPGDPAQASHAIQTTALGQRFLPEQLLVNSTHHQAVDDPGSLTVIARAPDGVIEAVALDNTDAFALGVQWHPELLGQLEAYQALIQAVKTRR